MIWRFVWLAHEWNFLKWYIFKNYFCISNSQNKSYFSMILFYSKNCDYWHWQEFFNAGDNQLEMLKVLVILLFYVIIWPSTLLWLWADEIPLAFYFICRMCIWYPPPPSLVTISGYWACLLQFLFFIKSLLFVFNNHF